MAAGFQIVTQVSAVTSMTRSATVEADSTSADTAVVHLKEVAVTAQLSKVTPSHAPFSLAVITSKDIAAQPVRAVSDALAYVQGVDLRQRGALGVQSDISIRGGTFEQAAIMIDGMRLNDVQTGHNTFSIPVLPSDIERIEVVKGGAARALGAGAMDGAVNIVLKQPTSDLAVQGSLVAGDASYQEGRISASIGTAGMAHRVSAQALHHAGWVPSSDVEMQSIMYNGSVTVGDGHLRILLGGTNKVFGANGFYTPKFPEQWEHVTTYMGGANLELPLSSNVDYFLRGLARVNHDEFRLKRYDPSFYTNKHTTEQYLAQTGATLRTGNNTTSVLLEGGSDAINSSNLGIHDRLRGSIIVESAQTFGALRLNVGGGLLTFSDRQPLPTASAELSYRLELSPRSINLVYASAQSNGRIPTYTDLYYKDPATSGNPLLTLEHAQTLELGFRRTTETTTMSLALYRRNGRDMIDYAIDSAGKARAENITNVDVNGVDVSVSTRLDWGWLQQIRVGLLYQDLQSSAPSRTRYVADNLRSQGVLDTRWAFPFEIQGTYIVRLVERVTSPTIHVVHDVRVWRNIGPLTLTVEATNLTNERFVETGWVTIPPRWARIGIAFNL